jgi:hypothetical protein
VRARVTVKPERRRPTKLHSPFSRLFPQCTSGRRTGTSLPLGTRTSDPTIYSLQIWEEKKPRSPFDGSPFPSCILFVSTPPVPANANNGTETHVLRLSIYIHIFTCSVGWLSSHPPRAGSLSKQTAFRSGIFLLFRPVTTTTAIRTTYGSLLWVCRHPKPSTAAVEKVHSGNCADYFYFMFVCFDVFCTASHTGSYRIVG